MSLQARLAQELKASMLAKDALRLSTLRLLKSAIGYVQLERKVEDLSDGDFVAVVQKEIKKRRDAIEQYEKGGRLELAEKEKNEIVVLEAFLPQPLSAAELDQLIQEAIKEVAATSKKEMGPVIKVVQAKAAGRADGRTISAAVGRILP